MHLLKTFLSLLFLGFTTDHTQPEDSEFAENGHAVSVNFMDGAINGGITGSYSSRFICQSCASYIPLCSQDCLTCADMENNMIVYTAKDDE